jgi:hypothetical protein
VACSLHNTNLKQAVLHAVSHCYSKAVPLRLRLC